MATLQEISKHLENEPSTSISLGNFDGVHLGHQQVFRELIDHSKKNNLTPVVLVLFPHPKEIFTGSSPALLTTLKQRKGLIQNLGIDHVYELTFTLELSEYSAEKILQNFQTALHMKYLLIGPTTHVGKNRQGNPETITKISEQLKFDVTIIQQQGVKGYKISSSSIRDCIGRGEMRMATEMLGRYYATSGIVESGMGKGTGLGFPTANLGHIQTMVPMKGVYAGYVQIDGQTYKSAINIGTRPTVTTSQEIVVEPHLLDFKESIVGKAIEIQWVERLRDEIKFDSIDQLKIQIQNDIRKTNSIL